MSFVELNNFDVLQYFKMKRVKNEQIQMQMNNYLKRRQYPENVIPGKKASQFIQGASELMTQNNVQPLSTVNNFLAYSSITGDVATCEQQFSRLKQFVCEAVEPYQSELQLILYPIFVHVFIEILWNGNKTSAHKFHSRYVAFFREDPDHQEILDVLIKLNSREDVLACKSVSEFRDHKYRLSFNQGTFDYLVRFLKTDDNMLMMQIFNRHLKIEVKSDRVPVFEPKPPIFQTPTAGQLTDTNSANAPSSSSSGASADKKPANDQVTKEMLLECIKRLQVLPPCLPSICFLAVTSAHYSLTGASVSDDRKYVVGGFEDSSIRLWSLEGSKVREPRPKVNPANITLAADYLSYDDDDNSYHKQYENWSVDQDQCVVLRGHSGSIYNMCFLPDPDPNYLLSCSKDTTIRLWDLKTCTNIVRYAGHNYPVWDIDVCQVSSLFGSASYDRTSKLWSTDRIFPVRSFAGHTLDVTRVKFHPNGMYVATGSADRSVRLWSINDGKCVRLMQGHRGTIFALAFSPNGQYLASSGDDRKIRVWDLNTGNLFKEFRGHGDIVYSLSFCRDGSMLASGSLDASIRIWDVRREAEFNPANADSLASPEQLACYQTKSTLIHYLNFTSHNLLLGAGPLI